MEKQSVFQLAKTDWDKETVVGFMSPNLFVPFTDRLIELTLAQTRAEYAKLRNDPQYREVRELLRRQENAARELIESGHLQDPEWIKNNVHVFAEDEVVVNDVYRWLNRYVKTPQGASNLARALVNEAGQGDNQMEIRLVPHSEMHGFSGFGSWQDSRVQMSEVDWACDIERWLHNLTLPHEIRHVGQQDIPNLSPREDFLYHAGIIEADARLTQFVDGISERRNPKHLGYRGLKNDLQAVTTELNLPDVRSWKDVDRLKKSNPKQYQTILGRLKEREFVEVLNHLMQTPSYQLQGSYAKFVKGRGNLNGLRAWCDQMCERQGMRSSVIWREVEAMATGKKEIPGLEGGFDAKGQLTRKGKRIFEAASRTSVQGEVVYDDRGNVIYGQVVAADGSVVESHYDAKGHPLQKIRKNANGVIQSTENYTYTRRGDILQKVVKDKHGTVRMSMDYTYDWLGRVKSCVTQYADHASDLEIFNTRGQVISRTYRWKDAETQYNYDAYGNELKTIRRDLDGNVLESTEYTYNSNRQKTGSVTKDGQGNTLSSIEYVYDDQARLMQRISHEADGSEIVLWRRPQRAESTETSISHSVPEDRPTLSAEQVRHGRAKQSDLSLTDRSSQPKVKRQRQFGNGKGLDDKISKKGAQRQLGNGRGLDDALDKIRSKQQTKTAKKSKLTLHEQGSRGRQHE